MKVFVVSDMEGVAGLVKWEQTTGGDPMYEEGRRLYTEEINAALCGHWDCPVLLVTGDEAVCDEGLDLLGPGLTTVAVKRGLGRFSARQIPPVRARELIEDGARRALTDLTAVAPYDPGSPCEIRVELTSTHAAEEYSRKPGVELVNSREFVSRADDWWSAWRQFFL